MPELPTVEAIEYRRELPTGTTKPCVFLCESPTGDTEEYVTKMRHGVRQFGLAYECIAFHLAVHFGIDCPPAALVRLSLDLAVAQKQDPALCDRIIRSVGLNFGSAFLPGYATWLPSRRVSAGFRKQAAEIIAFDALVDNADRRIDKPNLLTGPLRTVVIDHELIFSFLRLVGNAGPWFQRLHFLLRHPLYEGLKGQELNLAGFHERLAALTDETIDDICLSVPAEFDLEQRDRISDYLKTVRSEADTFIRGIEEVLR